jgi:hypothetical protein
MIRIVPLHPSALIGEAPVRTAPAQLTYRGGPLLKAVEVTAVFLGDWTAAQAQPITTFLASIVPSSYLDALSEYNVGHGSYKGSVILPWSGTPPPPPPPPPTPQGCLPMLGLLPLGLIMGAVGGRGLAPAAPTSITDADIQSRLNAAISAGTLPPKNANTLYMVYVQSGVAVVMSDGSASCSYFCGYHDSDGSGMYYGVIPYPDCAGCIGSLAAFDALTSVTTHELAEACTDAVPGTGWYDDANGEIGDICAWSNRTLNGYTVQLEWRNSLNACA